MHPEAARITSGHVMKFLNSYTEGKEIDFLDKRHDFLKLAIVELMSGVPLDEETEVMLREIMNHFVNINVNTTEPPVFNERDARVIARVIPLCEKLIKRNKASGNTNDSNYKYGLIANMIKDGWKDSTITGFFVNLLVAGGETPALLCCKTLAAMVANPECLKRAVEEIDSLGT